MCSPGPLGQRICVGVSPCSPPAVKKKTVQNCNVLYLGFTSGRCNTRSVGLFALLGHPRYSTRAQLQLTRVLYRVTTVTARHCSDAISHYFSKNDLMHPLGATLQPKWTKHCPRSPLRWGNRWLGGWVGKCAIPANPKPPCPPCSTTVER